jgi:hypothetical protein
MPHKDKELRRKYRREYYKANREKLNKFSRDWYQAHKEQCLAQAKRKYHSTSGKDRNLFMKYGLTGAEHRAMYIAQNGQCALCEDPTPYDVIVTDHDHETEKVRGLLCRRCNMFLGWIETKRGLLGAALEYCERGK